MKIFVKYLLLSILTLTFIEITLYFFLNYEWNRKPRPLGERNPAHIYYKTFHPLFRDLDQLKNNDLIVYDKFMDYSLGANSFLYRDYNNGYTSVIEVDEFKFSHNGERHKNALLQRKKENNEIRIIFLGGSTTFGTGDSNNSQTYPAQTERIINSLNSNDKFFLFINAGVLGYNLRREYIYLKEYLIKLNPDLIIFLDGDNDAYTGIPQDKFDKEFHSMKITKKNLKNNLFSFPQRLYLFNLLSRLRYSKFIELNFKNKNKEKLKAYYHEEVSIEFKKNIQNILEILESNNIKGMFYLQPNLFLKKKINKDEKILLELSYSRGV